jgi:hypothetical protein
MLDFAIELFNNLAMYTLFDIILKKSELVFLYDKACSKSLGQYLYPYWKNVQKTVWSSFGPNVGHRTPIQLKCRSQDTNPAEMYKGELAFFWEEACDKNSK